MTQREREILKASVSWTDKTLTIKEEKAFQSGAKWADRTMIEKACKWLENRHNIEKCLNVLTSRTEDLSKAFRQAMEE